MAVVYEIAVVEMESENVGTVLTEVELIDSSGDLDQWHTDMQVSKRTIGIGSGTWVVRHSQKSVLLLDDNGGYVEATLTYAKWPMKKGDSGDIFLRSPIKKGSSQLLRFNVSQVS